MKTRSYYEIWEHTTRGAMIPQLRKEWSPDAFDTYAAYGHAMTLITSNPNISTVTLGADVESVRAGYYYLFYRDVTGEIGLISYTPHAVTEVHFSEISRYFRKGGNHVKTR